jgi:hypothetical protein
VAAGSAIRFSLNIPVDCSLQSTSGRRVVKGGQVLYVFDTTDGRHFWLAEGQAIELQLRLAEQGILPRQPVLIVRESFQGMRDRYRASARWRVYRAPQRLGEQADGTFVVPCIPGARP